MRILARLVQNLVALTLAPWRWLVGWLRMRRVRWVHIKLRSNVVAFARPRPFWMRWAPWVDREQATPLLELTRLVSWLADDAKIEGVLIEIPALAAGWVATTDVRQLLVRLRERGKRVAAYLPEGASARELYLASAADTIVLGAHSTVSVPGLASVRRYPKALLDRIGVRLEVHRRAEFKSAVEPLSADGMSDPQREQTVALLQTFDAELRAALGARVSEAQLQSLTEDVFVEAEEARRRGLVDHVVHEDGVLGALGIERRSILRAGPYAAIRGRKTFVPLRTPSVIAIVPVHGAIADASAPRGGASRVQLVPTLRRVARDPRIAGVVLHVDSPGGSATASEAIHREVARLAALKPVVACFGEVAASGGYYVAAPAAAILARPQTVTGSIGVISARLVADELLSALGVKTEVVRTAPSADYATNPRAATEHELARAEHGVEVFYQRFLEVVAEGRSMQRDEVHEVARGRVWSGADAVAKRLVDRLGGLGEALDEVRARLGRRDLEPAIVWATGGEEAPIDVDAKRALLGALDGVIGGSALELLVLSQSGRAEVLAYASDLPRIE